MEDFKIQTSESTLQARIAELEEKQVELLSVIENKENEFGRRRAQIKELFLQKEIELNKQVDNLKLANEKNARLTTELENVLGERDNLKTAVLITKTSNDDEFEAIKSKYQEEITSLKAIMQDAIEETRQETSAKYEREQVQLVVANEHLETKLVKYKTQLKEMKAKQQQVMEDEENDGLFDVLSGAWKKPTSEENVPDKDDNLEDSMKKAQENAEALRSIVMPLEQEIAALRAKLRNANEKISIFEAKENKQAKSESQNSQTSERLTSARSAANVEELEEKVKELMQYLEAERSSRTDLEMFVAVLNTQKGVLQDDADKLRRELHNVCRLLEQEKEEHLALKDTWEMANDRFLETQRMQRIELDKIKKLLTADQQKFLDVELNAGSKSLELLTPPSPATRTKSTSPKMQKKLKTRRINSAEAKRTLSSLVRGPKPSSSAQSPILDTAIPVLKLHASPLLPSVSSIPCTVGGNRMQHKHVITNDRQEGIIDHKAFSDGEGMAEDHESSMKKYKSADDLETVPTNSLRCRPEELVLEVENGRSLNVEDVSEQGMRRKQNIDWKSFEEAAKSSLFNELDRSCAMCRNYEKQLQKLQTLKEDLSDETSMLSKQLQTEQENVIVSKRAYQRLEQSVKRASEDAQAQIYAVAENHRNLESFLGEINENVGKTNEETAKQLIALMESRDGILANFEQFQENSRKLSLNNVKQTEQGNSEESESQQNVDICEFALETKEEKLQSEIVFMKDRVMAEQIAKESMEELYQGEIDQLGRQMRALKTELDNEKLRSKQLAQSVGGPSSEGSAASKEVIAILEKQLQQASNDKAELVKQLRELKSQLHSLNGQLNHSESVQMDFVKLSQSLQMELEEMKECRKEIKWEHEEDVNSCRKCEKQLVESQDKHHCGQCGKIFCDACSRKIVHSSVSHKPLRVCLDCYSVMSDDVKMMSLMGDGGLDQEDNVNINRTSNEMALT